MNLVNKILVSVAAMAATLAHAANDRPVEATRYVNAQGVEVFVPRTPVAIEPAPVAASNSVAAPSAKASHVAVVEAPAASRKSSATASSAVSNEGRMDILMQELMSEQQALEVKRKVMKSPRVDVDLAAADKQKLVDDIHRHEENIRALGRELEQTRMTMTASTKTAMKPSAQKTGQ